MLLVRINKYLADEGYATRREADKLITQKLVFLNGRLAVLGDKVKTGDQVEVKKQDKPKQYLYFAYHKPAGEVTATPITMDENLFPLGRLDKDSEGLIILTNDGRLTDRLLNPEHEHEKEYLVETVNDLRPSFREHLANGVEIEGYLTKKCHVEIIDDNKFKIRLTEGKKHQIRRMVVALHNNVLNLKRVRIMNIKLGTLAPGAHRSIEGEELAQFLKNLGL